MPNIIEKPPTLYIGIDPGASGGLVLIGNGEIRATPMPDTEKDVWDWFADIQVAPCVAVIERVQGFIAGNAHPGSAMFKFGQSYGNLRMALIAAGIPFEDAPPQKWQKAMGCGTRPRTMKKGAWKNKLKAKAQQLFPNAKVTLATADALLIAEYCRRKHNGTL